jgi:hypothetical protein
MFPWLDNTPGSQCEPWLTRRNLSLRLGACDAAERAHPPVIAATLKVSGSTIYRTRRRFVEANLEGALTEEPRLGAERKLSSKEEARPLAQSRHRDGPAGPSSFWPMRWSGSPTMKSCPARLFVDGWRRTI